MRGDGEAKRYGATAEEWCHWDLLLGLGEHLLPVVSNPNAVISAQSKMKGLGKTPSRYNAQREVAGFSEWTKVKATPNQLKAWSQEPDYGICLQARAVRGLDIDVDDKRLSSEIACAFEQELGLDMPERYRTSGYKKLLAFVMRGDLTKRSFKVEGGLVELLAEGQQFIVAGQHPSGARYEWAGGLPDEIPEVTAEQLEEAWAVLVDRFAIEAPRESSLRQVKSGADLDVEDDVAEYLIEHWETFGVDRGKLYVTCPWKDGHSSDSGETESAWLLAGGKGYELGHYLCLHASCTGRKDEDFLDAVGYRAAQFECLPALVEDDEAPWDGESPRLPLPGFKRDKSGAIEPLLGNVSLALGEAHVTGMDVRYDQFRGELVWSTAGGADWQRFEDHHYFELRLRLERIGFKPMGKEVVRDAVWHRARVASIDTAMVWLDGLVWDGVPRIDRFFPTYFNTEDSAYARAVSLYAWTALAGRVLSPGCQVDMVPVLIGDQGQRKSSAFAAMVPGDDQFAEFDLSERDANQSRKMRGTLVGELAELRGLNSRDEESIKSWITQRQERWTPKYQEIETRFARRLVFFGSGNKPEILSDESGNRRWLPLISGDADAAGVARDRDQLWAEAALRWASQGVAWADAERLAKNEHDAFRIVDGTWEAAVERWLGEQDITGDENRGRVDLTTSSVLVEALGFDARTIKRADEMRASKIMQVLGFERIFPKVQGKTMRIWRPRGTT